MVNIYPFAFNPVISSLNPVTYARTLPVMVVPDVGAYSTHAVGGVSSLTILILSDPEDSHQVNVDP